MGSPPALACKFFLKTGKFGLFPLNFSITPAAHQQPHAIVPSPIPPPWPRASVNGDCYIYYTYIYSTFTIYLLVNPTKR